MQNRRKSPVSGEQAAIQGRRLVEDERRRRAGPVGTDGESRRDLWRRLAEDEGGGAGLVARGRKKEERESCREERESEGLKI